MATLTEASAWAAGIYRIERTDPVVGQDPIVPANIGIANQQAKELGDRTKFLRDQLDGAGVGLATMAAIANLDTLTKTGQYNFTGAATGAPIAAIGTVVHTAGAASTEASQTVQMHGSDRMFFRRRAAGTWQAWVEIWGGIQAAGAAKWQRLPSGFIVQCDEVNKANGNSVTFPIAFPNACLSIVMGDLNNNQLAGSAHIVGYNSLASLSGFTCSVVRHDGDLSTASNLSYIAIGN